MSLHSKQSSQPDPSFSTFPAHFNLENDTDYAQWRTQKLNQYPVTFKALNVPVMDHKLLTFKEKNKIVQTCESYNFVFYSVSNSDLDQQIPIRVSEQLGLHLSDKHLCGDNIGVSAIKVNKIFELGDYIPYTSKGINWHTDGYYNTLEHKIMSMILFCVRNAEVGGGNAFFDPDILYILLRDENPDFIRVLTDATVLTIPENRQQGKLIRPEQTGPVFSFGKWGMHMRYTARRHSINWKQNDLVKQATFRILEILNDDTQYKVEYKLLPGQGVISNNVLHTRQSFEESSNENYQRLIYRIRYYERMKLQ